MPTLEDVAIGHARLDICRTGLWLFIVSESMIFVLLLATRFALVGGGHPEALNQPLALLMTAVLLASGWPARRAVAAVARGDERGSSAYGTAFFTTTGFHGLHVSAGTLVWVSIRLQARRGRVNSDHPWGVEAAERYWHFVDVVWIFIYAVLYRL